MGENTESLKIFSIVFNNKVMQISYNTIFPEFKNQTVKSLILFLYIIFIHEILLFN